MCSEVLPWKAPDVPPLPSRNVATASRARASGAAILRCGGDREAASACETWCVDVPSANPDDCTDLVIFLHF